ncbi:hypothetical protein PPACK8108_LOCUS10545 [Phakopsora pachyrhizi]|uniref:Tho complex subunit 7/Mft1p n=1 Tax=Phakopsora pachyrhizi TaxID=170000 RepID=A0AAV0B236_PHAPC|nr:hypothetical protein PPACK8108_LOCUS10545 [Phakopsora pachyrhizi]
MAVAQDEATMELIRTRLSNSERPLIRVLRAFYRLSTLSAGDPEELQMCHATFLLELQSLTRSLSESRGIRMLEMTRSEIKTLESQKARLEDEAMRERLRISQLENALEEARRERRNKIQYEEIGKEVRRFGDRLQSAERINGLAKEIDTLLLEQGSYAERWASRRAQFDTVIQNLEVLQESIREEKEDADRKKALNDDESDVDNQEDPSDPTNQVEAETEAEDSNGGLGKKSGLPLNPNANSFLPAVTISRSGTLTPDGRSRSEAREQREEGQSGNTPKVEDQMEIDNMENNGEILFMEEEGLVIDDAAMEDGEEIEEAEEGEETEHN